MQKQRAIFQGRKKVSALSVQVIWTPPVQGMLKCNVDAAIFKEQNCFGA
ncbi:hypothetical protein A2U01_0085273, partial [Trifolium medium]|nr:hypothetical protein [Trifolium medium]